MARSRWYFCIGFSGMLMFVFGLVMTMGTWFSPTVNILVTFFRMAGPALLVCGTLLLCGSGSVYIVRDKSFQTNHKWVRVIFVKKQESTKQLFVEDQTDGQKSEEAEATHNDTTTDVCSEGDDYRIPSYEAFPFLPTVSATGHICSLAWPRKGLVHSQSWDSSSEFTKDAASSRLVTRANSDCGPEYAYQKDETQGCSHKRQTVLNPIRENTDSLISDKKRVRFARQNAFWKNNGRSIEIVDELQAKRIADYECDARPPEVKATTDRKADKESEHRSIRPEDTIPIYVEAHKFINRETNVDYGTSSCEVYGQNRVRRLFPNYQRMRRSLPGNDDKENEHASTSASPKQMTLIITSQRIHQENDENLTLSTAIRQMPRESRHAHGRKMAVVQEPIIHSLNMTEVHDGLTDDYARLSMSPNIQLPSTSETFASINDQLGNDTRDTVNTSGMEMQLPLVGHGYVILTNSTEELRIEGAHNCTIADGGYNSREVPKIDRDNLFFDPNVCGCVNSIQTPIVCGQSLAAPLPMNIFTGESISVTSPDNMFDRNLTNGENLETSSKVDVIHAVVGQSTQNLNNNSLNKQSLESISNGLPTANTLQLPEQDRSSDRLSPAYQNNNKDFPSAVLSQESFENYNSYTKNSSPSSSGVHDMGIRLVHELHDQQSFESSISGGTDFFGDDLSDSNPDSRASYTESYKKMASPQSMEADIENSPPIVTDQTSWPCNLPEEQELLTKLYGPPEKFKMFQF